MLFTHVLLEYSSHETLVAVDWRRQKHERKNWHMDTLRVSRLQKFSGRQWANITTL